MFFALDKNNRRLFFKHPLLGSFLYIIMSLMLLQSCKKDDDKKLSEPNFTPQFLYAGYSYGSNDFKTNNRRAIVIVNDSIIKLSPNIRAEAQAVYGKGKDVFVAGCRLYGAENRRIVSWKNGSIRHLSDAQAYNNATAIYEDQGKVYVAGTSYETLLNRVGPFQSLWVDGERRVRQGMLDFSSINAITTYKGNYFLAGKFAQAASIWHNNTTRTIRKAASNAAYIHATEADTIVLGYGPKNSSVDELIVWKNSKIIFSYPLQERIQHVFAYMEGKDYYFVTTSATKAGNFNAKVYKNRTLLYQLAPDKICKPVGIQVFQGNVYVLSNILDKGRSTPTLWKNGKAQTLYSADKNIYLNHFYISEIETGA
ncbi:MAG: hypothetical protein LBF27_13310 [Sphingobacterium sp.]|jgi:hypothetical protein|nr:hypothetical protein [Sphingobacterium sp.]